MNRTKSATSMDTNGRPPRVGPEDGTSRLETAMETALIVEDDPDQAEMAASFLQLRNLRPIIASDGRSALRLAREHRPEVILLDLMLPDIDGFEVCRQLRADSQTLTTPVVMLTALNGEDQRQLGFRVGANVYLSKPYGAQDLFEAIGAARRWYDGLQSSSMQGEIHLELHSATRFLREVSHFLMDLYRGTPLTTEQIHQLQQAVLEIGQNAIEWGNRLRVEDLVHLTYRVYSDRVEIVIRDQGSGFDRDQLPHAASYEDPLAHMDVREQLGLREGGFGLLIARGMVDELSHNDAGNQVTLIKRFSQTGMSEPLPEDSK